MSPSLMFVAVVAVAFAASWVLTGLFRRYALSRGIMDVPNARSSHVIPTPRGGGTAIVLVTLALLVVLGVTKVLSMRDVMAMTIAGTIAAAVGYADDHGFASLPVRLIGHFAAAGIALYLIGTTAITNALGLGDSSLWLATVLGVLYLVWMLNLTNFMDGIDGIASVEVITVCVGAMVCGVMAHDRSVNAFIAPLLLAAATAGFLAWNWPPARIFMGDAGSGFVGIMLATLSLTLARNSYVLLWSWLILLGVFVVDATVTLARRVARREQFYKAHRSHAYQHAAQRWGHERVTVAVAAINIVWLLPWAASAARGAIDGPMAFASATVPLGCIALWLGAGAKADELQQPAAK